MGLVVIPLLLCRSFLLDPRKGHLLSGGQCEQPLGKRCAVKMYRLVLYGTHRKKSVFSIAGV